jgi:hypothetical protein
MLTELAIRKVAAKGGQRVEIWDEKLPGFGLRASPAGTKTFVLMYYLGGRKRRMTLGRYPMLSLTDARQKAIEALAEVGGVLILWQARPRACISFDLQTLSLSSWRCIACGTIGKFMHAKQSAFCALGSSRRGETGMCVS